MYATFLKSRSIDDLNKYKKYRNMVTGHIRDAKRAYYHDLYGKLNASPDEMWRTVNSLFNRTKTGAPPLEIVKDDKTISVKPLADLFNTYFVNLAESQNNEPIMSHLSMSKSFSAFFGPTTEWEVCNARLNAKNSTAKDIDGLQIKPSVSILESILSPLTFIYKSALSSGVFPERMKHAKVTVTFKSGDKNSLSNYRPISVLPIFFKVFEE